MHILFCYQRVRVSGWISKPEYVSVAPIQSRLPGHYLTHLIAFLSLICHFQELLQEMSEMVSLEEERVVLLEEERVVLLEEEGICLVSLLFPASFDRCL